MARIKFEPTIFSTISKLTDDLRKIIDSKTEEYLEYSKTVRSQYLPAVADEKIKAKRAESKVYIDSARMNTEKLIAGQIDKIRNTVDTWAGSAPDDKFMNLISTIRSCGIAPDRTEFNNLLSQCGGSYWETKALSKLAEDSGISFNFPSKEVFDRKVTDIESGVNNFCRYYFGSDPDAWEIAGEHSGTSYGDIPSFSMSMADAYIRKGSFNEDADFMLNRIDDLYNVSTAPYINQGK